MKANPESLFMCLMKPLNLRSRRSSGIFVILPLGSSCLPLPLLGGERLRDLDLEDRLRRDGDRGRRRGEDGDLEYRLPRGWDEGDRRRAGWEDLERPREDGDLLLPRGEDGDLRDRRLSREEGDRRRLLPFVRLRERLLPRPMINPH
mmetsp:Transcript_3245/g.5904  ORF Transcript_3245/g.5904 Transcript_3245/m.5904 type:complete len:147 (+) Transcript_3245:195-635(+)